MAWGVKLDADARVPVGLEGIHNGVGVLVFFLGGLGREPIFSILHIDHLVLRVEAVGEEVEELVEEFWDGEGVSVLAEVVVVDDLEVLFEEDVGVDEEVLGLLVAFALALALLLPLEQVDGDRVLHRLLPLGGVVVLHLQAGEDRGLGALEERYDHQDQGVRAQEPIRRPNDAHLLGPELQEDRHDVEALVHLAVCVEELGVVDAEDVVDVEVHFLVGFLLHELQEGHLLGRHKNQTALLGHLPDDLGADVQELVLVVPQLVYEHCRDVDVAVLRVPEAVLAAPEARNLDVSRQQRVVLLVPHLLERLRYVLHHLVPQLQILIACLLILVHLLDDPVELGQLFLTFFLGKVHLDLEMVRHQLVVAVLLLTTQVVPVLHQVRLVLPLPLLHFPLLPFVLGLLLLLGVFLFFREVFFLAILFLIIFLGFLGHLLGAQNELFLDFLLDESLLLHERLVVEEPVGLLEEGVDLHLHQHPRLRHGLQELLIVLGLVDGLVPSEPFVEELEHRRGQLALPEHIHVDPLQLLHDLLVQLRVLGRRDALEQLQHLLHVLRQRQNALLLELPFFHLFHLYWERLFLPFRLLIVHHPEPLFQLQLWEFLLLHPQKVLKQHPELLPQLLGVGLDDSGLRFFEQGEEALDFFLGEVGGALLEDVLDVVAQEVGVLLHVVAEELLLHLLVNVDFLLERVQDLDVESQLGGQLPLELAEEGVLIIEVEADRVLTLLAQRLQDVDVILEVVGEVLLEEGDVLVEVRLDGLEQEFGAEVLFGKVGEGLVDLLDGLRAISEFEDLRPFFGFKHDFLAEGPDQAPFHQVVAQLPFREEVVVEGRLHEVQDPLHEGHVLRQVLVPWRLHHLEGVLHRLEVLPVVLYVLESGPLQTLQGPLPLQ